MAETLKRLGGRADAGAADKELFITSATETAVVSSIAVCNRGGTNRTFNLAHVDGALGAVATGDYFVFEQAILANSSQFFQLGITMGASDTILCRSNSNDVTFIAWGSIIA